MAELAALLLRDYTLNARRSTQRARKALDHLGEHLEVFSLRRSFELSSRYIMARSKEKASPATIWYEVAVLRRALTLAKLSGLIQERPPLAFPAVHNVRPFFVSEVELDRILAALPAHLAAATLFAYITGWRRSEVLYLRWEQVDLDAGIIRLEPGSTKNRLGRTYPYTAHPRLARVIQVRWALRDGPYVFHRNGKRHADLHKAWKKACAAAGLPHIVFHDLRRSAVRNLERARVPRSTAMQLTGHKTEYIYRRYAIQDESDLSRGVSLLAKAADEA